MYDHRTSIKYLEHRFPHLAEDFHDETWDGVLYVQITVVFAHWAQAVIDSGDSRIWAQITDAFIEMWKDCSPDVRNALEVSFLEHLYLKDRKRKRGQQNYRSWAYKAMPPMMRQAKEDIDDYNKKLHGG
ncbi:MAG TPA: hypothetical protein VFI27_05125 [candidate division Zixibacteria bacterium]|nr:hypothetical protein [candidate division Zixibacteria bacterium]